MGEANDMESAKIIEITPNRTSVEYKIDLLQNKCRDKEVRNRELSEKLKAVEREDYLRKVADMTIMAPSIHEMIDIARRLLLSSENDKSINFPKPDLVRCLNEENAAQAYVNHETGLNLAGHLRENGRFNLAIDVYDCLLHEDLVYIPHNRDLVAVEALETIAYILNGSKKEISKAKNIAKSMLEKEIYIEESDRTRTVKLSEYGQQNLKDPEILFSIGQYLLGVKSEKESAQYTNLALGTLYLNKALQNDPKFVNTAKQMMQENESLADDLISGAKMARDHGLYELCVSLCDLAEVSPGKKFHAAYFSGTAKGYAGNLIESVKRLKEAVEIDPKHEYARKRLLEFQSKAEETIPGEIRKLRDKNDYERCADLAEKYIAHISPKDFHANYFAGTALLMQGDDLQRAQNFLNEAVHLKPKHEYANKRLGQVVEKLTE
jgi:tetratricopeptide (TPR) repeat protein